MCDRQMDLSLSVNQISGGGGGGGDALVAPLAYFPPFTSQHILLGTLEVYSIRRQFSHAWLVTARQQRNGCTQGG